MPRSTHRWTRRRVLFLRRVRALPAAARFATAGVWGQASICEISVIADRLLADEFVDIFRDARDGSDVLSLHVEEERSRNRIRARRDVVEARLDAIHEASANAVTVLVEEAVAKDSERRRVCDELLYDEVVVFASLHVGAVLANRVTDPLVGGLVRLLERFDLGEGLAASLQREFVERVAGSRSRGRTEDFDLDIRQRGVDVFPGDVRIGGESTARGGNFAGQSEEDLLQREIDRTRFLRASDRNAVVSNLDLGDFQNPVFLAEFDFGGLDPPRCIGDIRGFHPRTRTEELEAAARPSAFDDRSLEGGRAPELFRDNGREGVDGRGSDDPDLVARRGVARPQRNAGKGQNDYRGSARCHE